DTPEPVSEDSEPSPEVTPEPVAEDSEPSPEDSEPVAEETPEDDPDTTEIQPSRQPQPKDGQTVTISSPTPTSSTSPQGEPYRIHTIRVETRYLDDLITQSGELTVTKIRIAHVANEINTLYDLWEEAKNHQNGHQNGNGQITHNLNEQIEDLLDQLKLSAQENTSRLDLIAGNLENRIRTLRLLPLSNIFQLFPRMVRDLSRQEGKTVELIIEGADTTADKRILEEMKDPLMHLIRNAIDHGIEPPEQRQKAGKDPTATIWLRGYQTTSNIIIEVADNGRGLNENQIKKTAIKRGLYRPEELESFTPNQIYNLIFLPSFSTQGFITEVSGRGVGLDVVYHNVEQLKGSIQVESTPGQGSTFRIQLGTTLATANVLLVSVQGITQAIPIEYVETSFLINPDDVFTIEGRETVAVEGKAISVAHLGNLLELGSPHGETPNHEDGQGLPCVLLNVGEDRFGVFVDELLDTQDVVLKPQSELLKRVRNVAGATILGTGEVCMILNPVDLLKSVQKGTMGGVATTKTVTKKAQKPSILLAEDSITIRTQEKRILEGAGYEVVTAVDGLDGWTKLRSRSFDAVVTDIQMPNLDGLALTERIRQQAEYNELPIILVTSLSSDEDRRRGVEAGANAYITKGAFNQDILLETLRRLV
ncbi:hybrid sensor histidine kinase/response regulator, partial [Spirulina sp. CS-785/01]|uniref:hybrid sensor histidine kinase/response regulator n=1 Tax=Spirulina sp. CS-785/01 TaxID=3021716 RepID=UPI00232B295D